MITLFDPIAMSSSSLTDSMASIDLTVVTQEQIDEVYEFMRMHAAEAFEEIEVADTEQRSNMQDEQPQDFAEWYRTTKRIIRDHKTFDYSMYMNFRRAQFSEQDEDIQRYMAFLYFSLRRYNRIINIYPYYRLIGALDVEFTALEMEVYRNLMFDAGCPDKDFVRFGWRLLAYLHWRRRPLPYLAVARYLMEIEEVYPVLVEQILDEIGHKASESMTEHDLRLCCRKCEAYRRHK